MKIEKPTHRLTIAVPLKLTDDGGQAIVQEAIHRALEPLQGDERVCGQPVASISPVPPFPGEPEPAPAGTGEA